MNFPVRFDKHLSFTKSSCVNPSQKSSGGNLFEIPSLDTIQRKDINVSIAKRKKGRAFIYVIAAGFLGLLILTSVTLWLTLQQKQNTTNGPSLAPVLNSSKTTAILTGGQGTPATLSRNNTDSVLSTDWLNQHFLSRAGVLSQDGKCIKLTICSETADPDQDGLINLYEYNFGTDPNDPDTDKDFLTDTIELFVYFTNPKLKDSDSDLVSDGESLLACNDPIAAGVALSSERKLQISSDIALFPLRQPSLSYFKNAGMSEEDISKHGFNFQKCVKSDQK